MKLTEEMIIQGKSRRGGWSREQFKLLGIDWPPYKGWKQHVIGSEITDEDFAEFLRIKATNEI